MIQSGGVFTHLAIPKVCSHTREVAFNSQQLIVKIDSYRLELDPLKRWLTQGYAL